MHVTLEVCIDSVASAIAAEEGGADRVELCSALSEGGLTPSIGLLKTVKKRTQKVKVFPIIRPRAGDFLYSEDEFQVMLSDIQELKSAGADGVVVGVLLADGTVDEERTRRLIEAARPLPVTFHRAFDMTRDLQEAFSTLLSLGIDRVLTSGACRSALDNLPLLHDLAKMAHQSNAPTRLMVCGGVRSHNAAEMLKGVSGGDQQLVSCIEVHSSGGRQSQGSGMVYRNPVVTMGHPSLSHLEYDVLVVSREEVRRIADALSLAAASV
eukprot:comp6035_c0_seq1/m.1879 comp6035_c0_seq1/g.1879  ORF comp6035_c0_seq1/g.1879 comp6035_c0_seq1/m.1879 type:complete len:267 (-) comp6035_c0_seq1:104-904(-)